MARIWKEIGNEGEGMGAEKERVVDVMEAVVRQKEQLEKEVEKYCKERGVNTSGS